KLHQRLQTTFIYVTHDQTEAMTMASRIVVMKDGLVQQVDSPQNLYDYPINEFVAGFIGSPQMNFFNVTLAKEGKDVVAKFGENKIVVPASKVAKITDESYIGKEVVMGIRPENINDDPEYVAARPDGKISASVEVTELMGSETYLYLKTSGKDDNIIARVDPHTASKQGAQVEVAFDLTRLHFFDKDTKVSILNR
ncbi:MAG: ABC transporter ATP-binding protein, partial [Clostridia bacterium]|nr:ABC transporter ATP-binding protein [Clostridia bacterium]